MYPFQASRFIHLQSESLEEKAEEQTDINKTDLNCLQYLHFFIESIAHHCHPGNPGP